jgi:hypothetical protein
MKSRYLSWLQEQGVPIFKSTECYWRSYNGALIPAVVEPHFIKLQPDEGKALLNESAALFLRYSSDPSNEKTDWWYITCDGYNPNNFSAKRRREIKRAHQNCSVRRVETQWVAEHGYATYAAAYARYKNSVPVSKAQFYTNILKSSTGPFEYWGVFVRSDLAGYCQCVVEENHVATNVIKLDPSYLKHYVSYALVDQLCTHYVVQQGLAISNGNRSVAHDTNFQDFLLKFGFRKRFCRLNITYQPWLRATMKFIFPLRRLLAGLPNHGPLNKLQILLFQEHLRRLCG